MTSTKTANPGESTMLVPQWRVTVNSRCQRACGYCRPSGEAVSTPKDVALNPDDLLRVAHAVRARGLTSVKLTGGDPALYEPLVETVRRLRDEAGFTEIEVISRHPRIGELAEDLAKSGVTLFNVSLDTLDPVLHHEICNVDDHGQVVDAIKRCVATGIPVKVNVVVLAGINDCEVNDLVQMCEDIRVDSVKLLDVIKDLDQGAESYSRRLLTKRGMTLPETYVPLGEITEVLRSRAVHEETVQQGGLGYPMTVLTLTSGMRVVVKDSTAGAWYGSVCRGCPFFPCHDALMALRLTADMRLQFCLLREDNTVDLAAAGAESGTALEHAVEAAFEMYADAYFRSSAPQPEAVR
ncbi:radical SAM protein [Streptomyces sp. 3211.6]|uniref:radical SAM protein n=1 Tax=Streptomyces sp. 3211.6 TaxID=1938845 RepID=UPI001651497F|nr:radical SAM protein [Streptomyces sp. 3211.6]